MPEKEKQINHLFPLPLNYNMMIITIIFNKSMILYFNTSKKNHTAMIEYHSFRIAPLVINLQAFPVY